MGMAAEVSSVLRIMSGYKDDHQPSTMMMMMNQSAGGGGGKSTTLITRDLLGGGDASALLDSKELDLDLQVPPGWEKRLDLKSGKVYLQRCNPPKSQPSPEHKTQVNQILPKFQDLNFPPSSKKPLNLFDDPSLDLKLVSSGTAASSSSSPSSSNYQSVCTLDKVKTALERAEKESIKKRTISMSNSPSPSSFSSSSVKESEIDFEEKSSSSSFAAGCPSCLLYVLISKSNPKCPRCNMTVPSPTMMMMKKPRIDLNISI